ncbi:MAG: hypothetical protein AAFN30_12995, partial [Actinomycetota bacterium]
LGDAEGRLVGTVAVRTGAVDHERGLGPESVELGRPVKKMIGGVTGWLDEGLTLTPGSAS